jgi:hypothetical protein
VPNLARFLINASPSSARGFDGTNGQALTFALEAVTSLVTRWRLEVYDADDPTSPLASKSAPELTLVGASSGQSVESSTPAGSITCSLPGSGAHSWIVRSRVNGGNGPDGAPHEDYVFERIISIRSGGRRKIVGTEATQYSPRGWADEQNDMVEAGIGGGGGGSEASINANLTATTHNWAPTDFAGARILRVNPSGGAWSVTGFSAAGLTQPRKTIVNVSGQEFFFAYESGSSTAANRILTPNSGLYRVLGAASVELYYDTVSSRWRVQELAYPLPAPSLGRVPFSVDGTSWARVGAPAAQITADANATLQVATAWNWIVPWQDTLSANRILTLGTTGVVAGDVVTIFFAQSASGGFHFDVANGGGGGGTLYSAPNTGERVVDFQFDGTNWAKLGQKRWNWV